MIHIKDFTDYKSEDANEVGLPAFIFIISLILILIPCAVYQIVVHGNHAGAYMLAFITLAMEVVTGTFTLIRAKKIEDAAEKNNHTVVKQIKTKGKRQGYLLFFLSISIVGLSTFLLAA